MAKSIKNVLAFILIFSLGIAAKSGYENEELLAFASEHFRTLLLVVVAFLTMVSALLWLTFYFAPWLLKRKYKLDVSLVSDQEMVSRVSKRIMYGTHDATDLSQRQQQDLAISRFGLWLLRREAISLYMSIILSVGGGIVGTATVYLLQEQNEKLDDQNYKLTLQTDATIVQSLLIEGTRRAALGEELTRILADITAEKNSTSDSVETSNCLNDNDFSCWVNLGEQRYYRLSTGMTSRLSSYLDQATSYHYSAGAVSEPDFDQQLRTQINLDYGSPERASVARRLDDLKISAFGLNFSGALLSQGQLEVSDFRESDFSGADLTNASFAAARLNDSNFSNARMEKSDFRIANLRGSILEGANLTNADLSAADLSIANLSNANLTNAKFESMKVKDLGLVHANLRDADLNTANLTGAILTGADLQGASLSNANLTGAILKAANLISIDLRKSTLLNTDFSDADMSASNFASTNLSGIIFNRTNLTSANFSNAWAWADLAPTLPAGITVPLCEFAMEKHDRSVKPAECITTSR